MTESPPAKDRRLFTKSRRHCAALDVFILKFLALFTMQSVSVQLLPQTSPFGQLWRYDGPRLYIGQSL